MFHQMQLFPEPFRRMASGQKTIELRLNDEKRRKLSIKDIIEFRNSQNPSQTIRTRVIALHRFESFDDLYASLSLEKCGYAPEEASQASARDMDSYYSPEDQMRWGVVGIELEILKSQEAAGLIKTSRYISMLLRHKPEAAGLTLDEHGWAETEELIRCVSKTRYLDMTLLEEIVATDNKQRYSFSPDMTHIRANQGHSIPVDVELEEKAPAEYLWHGTGEKYVNSIRQSGLKSGNRLYVHLSEQRDTAVTVGSRHGKPFLFRVRSGLMHADGFTFYQSKNGVWLTKFVPVEYLEEPDTNT